MIITRHAGGVQHLSRTPVRCKRFWTSQNDNRYMEIEELRQITSRVAEDLTKAAAGETSSFPFIRNPLPEDKPVESTFQVLVVGGSIFKKGLFTKKSGKLFLLSSSEKRQPTFHTKEDLLSFLLAEVDPDVSSIGLNFAYPLSPFSRSGQLDGRLVSGSKEHRFDDLVGKAVGEELENYIAEKIHRQVHISLANDTICLLLSGLSITHPDVLAAGVIGTGINMAFFTSPTEAINTEAANFNRFTLSPEATQIDKESVMPGKALLEKEISGGYLYKHYNLRITREGLPYSPISSTEELDALAKSGSPEGKLAAEVLKRSAQLSAALIAGIGIYKNCDLTFIIEGSLFWKGFGYKQTVEHTVPHLLQENTITFIKIEDSPLFGAAQLIS